MGNKKEMKSLIYSILIKQRERSSNPKTLILLIFSLAITFYFSIMFVSKVHEVNKDINFYDNKAKKTGILYLSSKTTNNFKSKNITIVKSSHAYLLNSDGNLTKTELSVIDSNYFDFFNFVSLNKLDWQNFVSNPKAILLHKNIARNRKIKVGDLVSVNGDSFRCVSILYQHDFKDKIVINESGRKIINKIGGDEYKSEIFIQNYDLDNFNTKLKNMKFESFDKIVKSDIKSLSIFRLFLIAFSSIFVLISLLNVYLIIYGAIRSERRKYLIKNALGESEFSFFLSSSIDIMLICLVSYHFSLVLYFILIPSVPSFFYYEISFYDYIINGFFIVISSIVISVIMCLKQIKTSFDELRY